MNWRHISFWTDEVIYGEKLFRNARILKRPDVSSEYTVIAETKISERLHELDIEASLSLSFVAGLIEVRMLQNKKDLKDTCNKSADSVTKIETKFFRRGEYFAKKYHSWSGKSHSKMFQGDIL